MAPRAAPLAANSTHRPALQPARPGALPWHDRTLTVLSNFCEAQVLPFDVAAAGVFDDTRSRKVRVGAMDLRIASIALSRDMSVLSWNLVDFGRVPGLMVEDWTLP